MRSFEISSDMPFARRSLGEGLATLVITYLTGHLVGTGAHKFYHFYVIGRYEDD